MHFNSAALKKLAIAGAAAVGVLALAGPFSTGTMALEIDNQDEDEISAEITEGESTRTVVVAGNSRMTELCSGNCIVAIDGMGTFEASPEGKITIRNGEAQAE